MEGVPPPSDTHPEVPHDAFEAFAADLEAPSHIPTPTEPPIDLPDHNPLDVLASVTQWQGGTDRPMEVTDATASGLEPLNMAHPQPSTPSSYGLQLHFPDADNLQNSLELQTEAYYREGFATQFATPAAVLDPTFDQFFTDSIGGPAELHGGVENQANFSLASIPSTEILNLLTPPNAGQALSEYPPLLRLAEAAEAQAQSHLEVTAAHSLHNSFGSDASSAPADNESVVTPQPRAPAAEPPLMPRRPGPGTLHQLHRRGLLSTPSTPLGHTTRLRGNALEQHLFAQDDDARSNASSSAISSARLFGSYRSSEDGSDGERTPRAPPHELPVAPRQRVQLPTFILAPASPPPVSLADRHSAPIEWGGSVFGGLVAENANDAQSEASSNSAASLGSHFSALPTLPAAVNAYTGHVIDEESYEPGRQWVMEHPEQYGRAGSSSRPSRQQDHSSNTGSSSRSSHSHLGGSRHDDSGDRQDAPGSPYDSDGSAPGSPASHSSGSVSFFGSSRGSSRSGPSEPRDPEEPDAEGEPDPDAPVIIHPDPYRREYTPTPMAPSDVFSWTSQWSTEEQKVRALDFLVADKLQREDFKHVLTGEPGEQLDVARLLAEDIRENGPLLLSRPEEVRGEIYLPGDLPLPSEHGADSDFDAESGQYFDGAASNAPSPNWSGFSNDSDVVGTS
ncbi:hypothetical protein DL93DRAFT_2080421 [Clavulina sp. PMI_390]|nr:hypothetical protein DL93DRAFT_2080421 [Clavulina sp. PMI_390]